MIDIVDYVAKTLDPVGVPAAFQAYPAGSTLPNQYITFMEMSAAPDLEAADVEITTERMVQLNIWSKGNYHQLVQSVRSAMEGAGFQRTFEFDAPYSDGDSHYNKVLRFVFIDEYE